MAESQTTGGICWKRTDICHGTVRCVPGQDCEADHPAADSKTTSERSLGRADGMQEAAAWLDDAAGLHVRGTEVWRHLSGAANFMRQRAEEISNVAN